MQHAKGNVTRYIAICGLSGFTTFPTSSHKRHDFQTKAFGAKKCVLVFLYNSVQTLIIMRKIERDNVISVHRSSRKVRIARVFVRFQGNVNFMDRISKPTQNSSFMKNLSVEQSCLV